MHLASINVLEFLVNTGEVLIKHKEILAIISDLLYAVCLLRLLREFNTLSFLILWTLDDIYIACT